ncbi:hypothetical protein DMN91_012081 [Ooceraea biroi]|uniref:DUF1907 domain-containing protein n=1 Tax=Ooceraea biroi TaxID=2015173 RepID=A0A3L8D7T7_OOCBI|nr:ester hydrolase C11orf54 homolog [Ooceraea biroi]XP_011341837.2 ester hydrolase C11orf54 homolog [Ooceraea biroi]XP_011341839.2 ester hydrolase C11orf54 homolog [Ooceraea biroi]RLU16321.1 hypothetical protein DMN91_012081 [Ooceraea biroi]
MDPGNRQNVQPLEPSKLSIKSRPLYQPSLEELVDVLEEGLRANFVEVTIGITDCPNFNEQPYNFHREGLCGNPIVFDIGDPAYLLPSAQRDKFYDVKSLLRHLNYNTTDCLVIGAGAGPWPRTGCNCELIMKMHLSPRQEVENATRYAFVGKTPNEECVLHQVPVNEDETTFALLGNLYVCEGRPGQVIGVRAKKRTGNLDFIACMQKALGSRYKDKLVGMGGTFVMRNGKIKQHVMRDFSKTPLNSEAELNNWLRFYEMETPLTAVGTFVSAETDLDLRVQHFHSASDENKLGGHYHIDTTPDTIEYEGYFNVATIIHRVDQPANKLQFGKD